MAVAGLLRCSPHRVGVRLQPRDPLGPPAAADIARVLKPLLGPRPDIADPVIAFVLRRRVDPPCDVAAAAPRAGNPAAEQPGARIRRPPRPDVILTRGGQKYP